MQFINIDLIKLPNCVTKNNTTGTFKQILYCYLNIKHHQTLIHIHNDSELHDLSGTVL